MLSGISDLPACEESQCSSLKVFTLCVLSADFIPITARSFFIVLCSLVPTCTFVTKNPENLANPRVKINKCIYVYLFPGSFNRLKAPRMLVGYTSATDSVEVFLPQSMCCCSDILQVLVFILLFIPKSPKLYLSLFFLVSLIFFLLAVVRALALFRDISLRNVKLVSMFSNWIRHLFLSSFQSIIQYSTGLFICQALNHL